MVVALMRRSAALVGMLAGWAVSTAAAAPADPAGTWLTQDGRARIRLERCGGAPDQVCGYVVWLRDGGDPSRADTKNPDPGRRSRALLGHQLLAGLKANADNRYEGQIYNSEDGKKYDVTLWLDGQNDLKLRGCLIAFLCSTQDWKRTSDLAPGQLAGATGTSGGPQPDRAAGAAPPAAAPRPAAKPKS